MVGALDECFGHVDVPGPARPVKGSAAQFVLQVHVGTLTHQQFDNGQAAPKERVNYITKRLPQTKLVGSVFTVNRILEFLDNFNSAPPLLTTEQCSWIRG